MIAVAISFIGLLTDGCQSQISSNFETQLFDPVLTPSARANVNSIQGEIPIRRIEMLIPCANDGYGELAVVERPMVHFKYQQVTDGSGGIHTMGYYVPSGKWEAVGELTGDKYHLVGILDHDNINVYSNGYPITSTNKRILNWIGKGRVVNFNSHFSTHLKIDKNGDVTVDVLVEKITCR